MFPAVTNYLEDILSYISNLSRERKKNLKIISKYISDKLAEGSPVKLVFICTHNSRRSHMGQIWAQVLADWYEVPGVSTYSGGTEATAFHPNAVEGLRKSGLQITAETTEDNPRYQVSWEEEGPQLTGIFSKKFTNEVNPSEGFMAIMVCSDADEACPFVSGAEQRVAIPYDDPKAFDGTDQEAAKYEERSRQIAAELSWMYQQV